MSLCAGACVRLYDGAPVACLIGLLVSILAGD